MKQIPAQGILGEAALKEAATGEYRQVIELVQAALAKKLGIDPGHEYLCIEAIFADRVVLRREGRFWSYGYTLTEDNQVMLADAQEVVETYLPVRMAESAGADFLEAKDEKGLVWEATLIRAGLSKNGTFYPDAVLREAAALFDGRPVFAKADAEHLHGAGKDVRNLIGWISSPRFVEGLAPDTGRVIGRLNFSRAAERVRELIADAWSRGKRDLVGLSIDAVGKARAGLREGVKRVAAAIEKVTSVDLIVEPAAGGELIRMVEAVEQENDTMKKRMLERIKAKLPQKYAQLNVETATDEEIEALYREAIAPAPAASAGVTAESLAETVRMVEARANARVKIYGTKLPKAAQDRIWAGFESRERFVEADVDAAIKAEREYLVRMAESLGDSGKVQLAAGEIEVEVEDRSKKIADMLDAFFDPAHKDHGRVHSFKECYMEITGDRLVTGRWDQVDKARLREAVGAAFRESLDTAAFANVLGSTLNRRLVADYRAAVEYDLWRRIASVVPLNDFRTQERVRFGGYGDLPTVAQGAAYTALTSPSDEKATYAPTKRGGTEDLTLEMIKNDDVGVIRRIPVRMGRAAKRTLAKFVFDFIRTNPTIYDSVALFHATHGNLGSTALAAAELTAARLAMLKQTEAGSSDRLGVGPKSIMVAPDLQETAWNLQQRGTNLDKTFVQSLILDILPVWYWTDTNDWALAADPNDIPTIEVGFLDGNEEPELFVQDTPTVGSMFTHDKLTYKIRHVYGGAVVDYRGLYKEVVA